MTKKSLGQIILIFLFFLIKEVKLSPDQVLSKYGSIKTEYSSMIINSTEFNLGDDIYLTINSDLNCDDYLRYQFYDKINDIYNQSSDLKYNMRAGSTAKTNILGRKTHFSLYYTINKNKGILENLKGNLLYIEFKCEGDVEIKNTKDDPTIKFLYFGIFIITLFLIIFCLLLVKKCLFCFFCLKYICKRSPAYNLNNIPNTIDSSNNQLFVNYPQNRIVYVTHEKNANNNNMNHNFNPNNVASNVPEYPPRQIYSERSDNTEVMNSSERNLVSQGS